MSVSALKTAIKDALSGGSMCTHDLVLALEEADGVESINGDDPSLREAISDLLDEGVISASEDGLPSGTTDRIYSLNDA